MEANEECNTDHPARGDKLFSDQFGAVRGGSPRIKAKEQISKDGITFRAVAIGLAFIPANVYLVVQWETVWGMQYPTTMGIFFNAIFSLLIVVISNSIFKIISRRISGSADTRKGLSQSELMTIYIILLMAITVSGHDFSQSLFCTLGVSKWFATPENEWSSIFGRYVPQWLSVNDEKVLRGFYEGESSLYTAQHIKGWLVPIIWWTSFLAGITFVTICINTIIRKQWIEREKLTYPLTHLPYEMVREDSINGFFRKKLLWVGLSLAIGIGLINGFNTLSSAFPRIMLSYDLGNHFTDRPLNSIGSLPLYVNPYALGLAFPIPLDLLFSCWFFFMIWKLERVIGSIVGVSLPGYPFEDQQILGSYLGIAIVSVWMFRKPMYDVLKRVFGIWVDSSDEMIVHNISNEPMSYRMAVVGMIMGMAFLLIFCYESGMSVLFAFVFFLIYFAIAFAYTRMRAEIGPPLQGIHYSGPLQLIVAAIGSRRISAQTLTVAAPFWTMTKEFRNIPAPFQLESFKLAERTGVNLRKIWKIMMLSTFLGLLITFWAYLQFSYKWGGIAAWRGVTAYNTVEKWITNPVDPDMVFISVVIFGAAFVVVNTILRLRFLWWNLHPLGYPLAGYYHFDKLWFPFFISWLVKWGLLKYGGIKSYRKAFPLFMGLVLGDFIVGSLWGITGLITGKPTYAFKNW